MDQHSLPYDTIKKEMLATVRDKIKQVHASYFMCAQIHKLQSSIAYKAMPHAITCRRSLACSCIVLHKALF